MKTIFIARHGEAVNQQGLRDVDRPLTKAGQSDVKRIVRYIEEKGPHPEIVLSSPLKRAQETTGIIAKHLSIPFQIWNILSPGAEPKMIYQALFKLSESRFILVGHAPDVGQMATFFVRGPSLINFRPGAVACFDYEVEDSFEPKGLLKWFISPDDL